jgi:spore coat polysaccharide biosynthesis protein SpsF
VIDEAVRLAQASGAAYTSNRVERTFPAGLEVEVVTVEALRIAAAEVRDPLAMISPTAAIRARPDRFAQAHLKAHRDWSHYDWRVKTPADLAFARSIYNALYPADPGFSMHDVLDLVESHQDLGGSRLNFFPFPNPLPWGEGGARRVAVGGWEGRGLCV